jgi:signal transduction histidine kinase
MLANLIGNALKYNCDGRPVIVTLQRDGDLCVLSVADQGIGIPAEELPRVVERGYRASNVASAADGLGLGLAGAKETVTALRGTIEVESQKSVGTTVTVRLPRATRAATEAGYDAAALAGFYTGTQPVLRSDGDWRVLTPAGKQWYEERALMLLSRSE